MPPKKPKAPTKAELIVEQATAAKALKEASWTAFWNHRKDHITKGENKGGTPVGYHTKLLEGNGAVCKTFGEATQIPGSGGCYKQWVAVLSNNNPSTATGQKTKSSTFFPTKFTLQQIEAVCKSAFLNSSAKQDTGKNFTAVSTVNPGNGMNLNFTADSIYPEYDK